MSMARTTRWHRSDATSSGCVFSCLAWKGTAPSSSAACGAAARRSWSVHCGGRHPRPIVLLQSKGGLAPELQRVVHFFLTCGVNTVMQRNGSFIVCCHPEVHVAKGSALKRTRAPASRKIRGLPFTSADPRTCMPHCVALGGAPQLHSASVTGSGNWRISNRMTRNRKGATVHSGVVGAWAKTTPEFRPEWDLRWARRAAVQRDSIEVRHGRSPTLPAMLPLVQFPREILRMPFTMSQLVPWGSPTETFSIHLVGILKQVDKTPFLGRIMGHGKLHQVCHDKIASARHVHGQWQHNPAEAGVAKRHVERKHGKMKGVGTPKQLPDGLCRHLDPIASVDTSYVATWNQLSRCESDLTLRINDGPPRRPKKLRLYFPRAIRKLKMQKDGWNSAFPNTFENVNIQSTKCDWIGMLFFFETDGRVKWTCDVWHGGAMRVAEKKKKGTHYGNQMAAQSRGSFNEHLDGRALQEMCSVGGLRKPCVVTWVTRSVDRYTSHETSSRHIRLCAHITLWLNVSQRVSDTITHAHVITCLSVCCFLTLSSSSLSRASTFSLTVCLFSVLLINFHVVKKTRGIKPLHSRTMRSIALWRYTTLSQVMSPTSSTTSTTQRLLQRSSTMNPAT